MGRFSKKKSVSRSNSGGSWTTVKGQMARLYADRLAEEGYATLALDPRYYGESGGVPRFVELPQAKPIIS